MKTNYFWTVILLVTTIALSSCGAADIVVTPDMSTIKNVSLSTAKKDFFIENSILPGKVSPIIETSLSPQVSGIIKTINVDAGQTIKAGQVLATLDLSSSTISTSAKTATTGYDNALSALSLTTESVKKDLESAKIQLENAKISRENIYTTTEKQLAMANTQLDNIQTTKSNTQNTTGEAIKAAKIWVDLAEKSLNNTKTSFENFKKNSDESLGSLYENIRVTLGSAIVTADAGVNQADIILGVTDKNRSANDAYEIYLWAKDVNIKIQSEKDFATARSLLLSIGSTNTTDRTELEKQLAAVLNLIQQETSLYDDLVRMANNSIVSSVFPQTQLDGLSLTIAKNQASLLQTQAGLTTLKNSLSTTKTSIDTNTVTLSNAVDIAESQLANARQSLTNLTANNQSALDTISGNETLTRTQLENTVAVVNASRESADNALKIAQAQYASAKAKLDAQLVGTKSQADAAKWSKDMANIQLSNTQIIAPFDGVVLSKNIEVGQSVSPGTPLFSVGNTSSLKVKMDVNANQINSFTVWKNIIVKKDNLTLTGIISTVSPGSDPVTKLFRIELLLDKTSTGVLSGDFVDVIIEKKVGEEKIIAIPFAALVAFEQGKYGIYTVGSGSTAVLRTVTIGAQNATQVEILSGLNEGESYISNGVLTVTDGDKINVVK